MGLSPKQKLTATITCVCLFVGILIAGLTAIGVTAKKTAEGKTNYYIQSNSTLSAAITAGDQSLTFMSIEASMFSIDVSKNEAKMMLYFALNGNLNAINSPNATQQQKSSLIAQSPYAISLTVGSQILTFPAGRPLTPQTLTLVLDGDINTYPFDTLSIAFPVYGTYTVGGRAEALPISLFVDGMPTGFKISYDIYVDPEVTNTELYATGSITRSATIQTIATFIAVLMWGLAIACSVYTASLFVFEKKAEPPVLGFHIALLFAMPTVRNAMPLAPPVGCLIDQMVLVWVMMILAICVLCQFGKLISQISEGGYAKLGLGKVVA
ncbi:hypothetical protein BCR33DRAFT_712470 [Rhizoclosmatium globosum]|uniref:DUF4436 domain-containing protein n=1 Tax=Rhizoclosmatium globosum TaxID=329046 RepID=A0A1Y2CWL4_9FUNG|nr:hypothetical protein BCR33DRAFT_712470 [Rhizoclosmatium globosum]|eukprot:ORY51410.1 hypothetical protein BCR33DRAFT_712470 [Rhizoclosmatium globosum]